MCGEDSSVMEQEGSKSKSRWVRLMVERYGQAAEEEDGGEVDAIVIICIIIRALYECSIRLM